MEDNNESKKPHYRDKEGEETKGITTPSFLNFLIE
jgi:hypothetical protein